MPRPHTTRMSFALPLTAPRRHRATRAVAAVLCACGLGAGTLAPGASAATVPAHSAGAYRDSVGVQMHHSFTGYAYQTESAQSLGSGLRALGIRHVRDSACLNTETACAPIRAKLADLRDELGPGAPSVEVLLNLTQELKSQPDRAIRDADIERALRAAQSPPLAGMVSGLESVNEPDLKGVDDWQAKTLADDATTSRLLAEPRFAALRGVPRLTPAVGHAKNTPLLLGAGWPANRNHTPNFHPYPPAWGGPENGLTTPCTDTADALGCVRQLASGGAPIASESGYTTAGGAFSQSWVSEKAQAVYLPRLLLENFSRGVARTYLYELIDLAPERTSTTNGYGLWRARRAGSTVRAADPKPAAWALARLHARIGDLGAASAASPLNLTLRSAGEVVREDTVRRVLLQRADGTYALALWQPKSVFDNAFLAQKDRTVADLQVELSIETPIAGGWAATAFRPTLTGEAVGKLGPTSRFTAAVGPDVTLIDLRSAQAPSTSIPGSSGV
ncbi:MAG: hypothetical protein JHD16_17020, partial [Solirubrobacteraceae bacterium]|nr:hypothetical protein [Solirubrobacteraceae bacterium]